MEIEMPETTIPPQAEVKIEFSLTAKVNVTDFTAQRKVSKLLLDEVGNLLYGDRPSLVAGRRLLWRVPILLGSPATGPLGKVGTLDVDAQTGEILFSQQQLNEMAARGNTLYKQARAQRFARLRQAAAENAGLNSLTVEEALTLVEEIRQEMYEQLNEAK